MRFQNFYPDWENSRRELLLGYPELAEEVTNLRVAVCRQAAWMNVVRDAFLLTLEKPNSNG